jgi:hypothetical protein
MQINVGRCPSCEKPKAMRPVANFREKNWTGAQCRLCGFFVPDVVSEQYDMTCDGCGKSIGRRAFDRHFFDLDEEDAQALSVAQIRNSVVMRGELDKLSDTLKAESDPAKAQAIQAEIDRRIAANKSTLQATNKVPQSWQKRHADLRRSHFCADCHGKRRASGTDFSVDGGHVHHDVCCTVCGKPIHHLYIEEHHTPEHQEKTLRAQQMNCAGACAEYEARMTSKIRETLNSQ